MKRLALLIVAVLVFSACSDETEPTVTPTSPTPTQATTSPSPTGGTTVAVASSSLGSILVDGEGRTLYVFLRDTGTTSTCEGDCAATWPPLTATGTPQAGTGANASLLGTSQRADGGAQVTYNGHPLYYFASDAAAGDTNGQGIGGIWYVVSPAGEAIKS